MPPKPSSGAPARPGGASGRLEFLTRKAGPLPVWAWAVGAIVIGYVVYRRWGATGANTEQPASPDTGGQGGHGNVAGNLAGDGAGLGGGAVPPPPDPTLEGDGSGGTGGGGMGGGGINGIPPSTEQNVQPAYVYTPPPNTETLAAGWGGAPANVGTIAAAWGGPPPNIGAVGGWGGFHAPTNTATVASHFRTTGISASRYGGVQAG